MEYQVLPFRLERVGDFQPLATPEQCLTPPAQEREIEVAVWSLAEFRRVGYRQVQLAGGATTARFCAIFAAAN